MSLNNSTSYNRFALEYYDINSGKISAVNYWSPGISNGAYADTNTGKESNEGLGGVWGRLELSNESFSKSGKFHWTRTVEGTDLPASL